MKIDNSVKSVAGIVTGGSSPTPKRTDKAAGGEPQAGDANKTVALSRLSSQLQAIESSLSGNGALDTARIQEIKQAISEGRFRVNAEVVADRLLDTVKELLQAHRNRTR